jgi:hypothetical protein
MRLVDPGSAFPEIQLERLNSREADSDADFVLTFVPPDRLAELAIVPPLGIWWFRFGGVDYGNGQLAFSAAIASDLATLQLELLAEMPEGSRTWILSQNVLKRRRSHRANLESLSEAGPSLCLNACRRMRLDGRDLEAKASTGVGASPLPMWKLIVSEAQINVRKILSRLFFADIWSIGIIDLPIDKILQGAPVPEPQWLDPPKTGRFHADPFPLSIKGQGFLLFEVYDDLIGRGWIAIANISDLGKTALADAPQVMRADCHMSYPFVFEYGGETFCVPEMSERGGLNFYKLCETDRELRFVTSIMENVPLIDPTLFIHEGRWWLFATLQGGRSDTDLHAWFADDPFGSWTPHPLNPVKSDVRSARPAGAVFKANGKLYRPAQDCTNGYGDAVVINHVTHLSPVDFKEAEVTRVEPCVDWQWSDGLHTFNCWKGQIVIDAKRRKFKLPWLSGRTGFGFRERVSNGLFTLRSIASRRKIHS